MEGLEVTRELIQEEVANAIKTLLEAEGDDLMGMENPPLDSGEESADDIEFEDDDMEDDEVEESFDHLDDDFVERIGIETIKQIQSELGGSIDDVNESSFGHGWRIDVGSREYYVFADYDDAEQEAKKMVKQYLEDEPESFEGEWLQSHIYITDTDRRMISNDEGNSRREDGVFAREFDEEFNLVDKDDVIDELGQYLGDEEKVNFEAKYAEWDDYVREDDSDSEKREALEEELDSLVESLKESAKDSYEEEKESEYIDSVEKQLEDPIQYFCRDHGMYSEEDLMKASFINIDTEAAAEDAVSVDGVEHFLSSYDGNVDEIGNAYLYRIN